MIQSTIGTLCHANDHWNVEVANRLDLDPVERLDYRSNILGVDQRITNPGGGNTSSRTDQKHLLTQNTPLCSGLKAQTEARGGVLVGSAEARSIDCQRFVAGDRTPWDWLMSA
ncbi:MAG: hypothetical protein RIG82_00100 [Phycisphaeraceae bacterium]